MRAGLTRLRFLLADRAGRYRCLTIVRDIRCVPNGLLGVDRVDPQAMRDHIARTRGGRRHHVATTPDPAKGG